MKRIIKKTIFLFLICFLSLILFGCKEESDNKNLDIFIEKFYSIHPNGYNVEPKWYRFNVSTTEVDFVNNTSESFSYIGDAEFLIENSFNVTTSKMQMTISKKIKEDNYIKFQYDDSIKFTYGNFFKEYKTALGGRDFHYSKTYRASDVYACELRFDFNIDILMPSVIVGEERLKFNVDDNMLRLTYSVGKEVIEYEDGTYCEININETYLFSSEMKLLSISRSQSEYTFKDNRIIKSYKKSSSLNFTTHYNIDVPSVAEETLVLDKAVIFEL